MNTLIKTLLGRAIWLITHKATMLASTMTLAGFALWDIFDQTFLDGTSPVGVEHGVAIHGIVMALKSAADFFEKTSDVVKARHEAHLVAKKPDELE